MNKPLLGMLVGTVLGVLDGLSAWAYPDARPMIVSIVVGSTLKGLVTGVLAGIIARRVQSVPLGVAAGAGIGFALSSLVALGQPEHYWDIVLPGMLVGVLVGFATQRYPRSSGERRGGTSVVVISLVLLASPSRFDARQTADPFAQVSFMVGRWESTIEGQPGKGNGRREYTRVLNNRFIRILNRSEYPPQEKNPKGEIHDDEGFFSFDRARKRLVLRQFHVESFVVQYVQDAAGPNGELVFTSEAIENIPAGYRARETYISKGPDAFEEVFEMAAPGQSYEMYSRQTFTRVK
jgi:hypothetical protein